MGLALVKRIVKVMGGIPSPFDAWLANLGLKTFELRMQRHCENALQVARFLATHPAVAEVAVLGAPDAEMGEQVVAVIVPRAGETLDAAEIIAYCRERLASYKKPRRVVFVETLPRNALGKVQKHLLSAQLPPA